jgi:hypothetical protein
LNHRRGIDFSIRQAPQVAKKFQILPGSIQERSGSILTEFILHDGFGHLHHDLSAEVLLQEWKLAACHCRRL